MGQKTPLYEKHLESHAKIVDFAGWDMPLHYGSQIEEHHYVRQDAGIFDVSHMTVVDVIGKQAYDFLRVLLANDIAKLQQTGKALYSCMLNEQGGIVDDLIVYYLEKERYRLVVNSGTREKDLLWIRKHAQNYSVQLTHREDLAILAVQGPHAIQKSIQLFDEAARVQIEALHPFEVLEFKDYCIARTGYTGEDGLELIVPAEDAPDLWEELLAEDIKPCGLGARDTLRLEAGLNLYGADMNENTTPYESNLNWTVSWQPEDRNFIGRAALVAKKAHIQQKLIGLVLEQKGVLRNHQKVVVPDVGEGEITSGSFSPTLQQAIALARVPVNTKDRCFVEIRGQMVPARVVKPSFVRHGKSTL